METVIQYDKASFEPTRGKKPSLSVVVPVFNVERYLPACLDSLIEQTFQDLEIVVVNDCSPDNSESIILEYQSRDERIRYVTHQKNLGLGGARNTGIKHATGEWIAFVDSDDYVEANCYKSLLALILLHGADGAVFPVVKVDDASGTKDYRSFPFNTPFANPTRFDARLSYIRSIGPTVCNRVYRRSDLVNNGIWFPEHLKHEDEEFTFKYMARIEPLLVYDGSHHYHYRQRAGSIMVSSSTSRLDLSRILINIHDFLRAEHLNEEYRPLLIEKVCEYLGFFARPGSPPPTPVFMAELSSIVRELVLSQGELDRLPPYFLAIYITDSEAQASFFGRNLRPAASLESDKWYYRFGRLTLWQKLVFLIDQALKRLKRAVQR